MQKKLKLKKFNFQMAKWSNGERYEKSVQNLELVIQRFEL